MNGFHDIVFPLALAFGASGGPQRQTDIVTLANGAEYRNSAHANSRRRYNASAGIKSLDDVHQLIAFFEARRGPLNGFLFKDGFDYKSCLPSQEIAATDQLIGYGDGLEQSFALHKHYGDMAATWTRRITYPLPQSVVVAIDAQPVNGFDVLEKGLVRLHTPPDQGQEIRAGFAFYVPVRFENDQLTLTLEAFGAGDVAAIPLIEIMDA